MSNIAFRFDQRKAIETILYLTKRVSDSDVYGICKLIYLADKTNLEKYGRFIFGETYSAMRGGATPSHTYNLIKRITETPTTELRVEGKRIIALRDANLNYFSESDIECLEQIVAVWGNEPNWSRGNAAHDEAYQKAWNKRGTKGSMPIMVESIAELLDEPEELVSYLSNSDNE